MNMEKWIELGCGVYSQVGANRILIVRSELLAGLGIVEDISDVEWTRLQILLYRTLSLRQLSRDADEPFEIIVAKEADYV